MRYFAFSIILSQIIFNVAVCQITQRDYKWLELKGKVKTLQATIHEVVDSSGYLVCGKLEPHYHDSPSPMEIYEFDSNCNILSNSVFDEKSDLVYQEIYTYTSNLLQEVKVNRGGKVSIQQLYHYNGNYISIDYPFDGFRSSHYTIDKDGNTTSRYQLDSGNQLTTHLYYFYDKGNVIIESDSFDERDGRLIARDMSKFDSMGGNILENTHCYPDGRCSRQTTYKYDKYGNKIEIYECYYIDDTSCYKNVYKYNIYGNVIEDANYNSDGSLNDCTYYIYDSLHNEIFECHSNAKDSTCVTFFSTYNNRGNLIEYGRTDSPPYIKYIYKYDIYNNWIEKIYSNAVKPVRIYKRVIQYY